MRKEDGKLNWKFIIIGTSWKKFLLTTILVVAILLMAYGYVKDREQYMEVYENPCNYCSQRTYIDSRTFKKLNISEMNLTITQNEKERSEKTKETDDS